jgi:hypothetical protein
MDVEDNQLFDPDEDVCIIIIIITVIIMVMIIEYSWKPRKILKLSALKKSRRF